MRIERSRVRLLNVSPSAFVVCAARGILREALECGSDRATALGGRGTVANRADVASITRCVAPRFHRPPKAVALPPHSKVRAHETGATFLRPSQQGIVARSASGHARRLGEPRNGRRQLVRVRTGNAVKLPSKNAADRGPPLR